jgi:hypothetical protein
MLSVRMYNNSDVTMINGLSEQRTDRARCVVTIINRLILRSFIEKTICQQTNAKTIINEAAQKRRGTHNLRRYSNMSDALKSILTKTSGNDD